MNETDLNNPQVKAAIEKKLGFPISICSGTAWPNTAVRPRLSQKVKLSRLMRLSRETGLTAIAALYVRFAKE